MGVWRHEHEDDRLVSLRSYEVLDAPQSEDFDGLTRLAARVCGTPFAAINLVDDDRYWTLSMHGLPRQTGPRSESICSDAVAMGSTLLLPDVSRVERYAAMPYVTGAPGVRGYAGVPLVGRDGLPLGTLCVLDVAPRIFTEEQLGALTDLARQAVTALELRRIDVSTGRASPLIADEAEQPWALRRALDNHEFAPHFQPVVDLRDASVLSLEALIRWQHPTRGLLAPETFLAGMEHTTLLDWAAHATLETACRLMVDLGSMGYELPGGVSVNVSGRQLNRSGMAPRLLARLARNGLPGSALTVEITETAEVSDLPLVRRELLLLRDAGVRVVADDFGVGWSNLVRLLQLPLSGLKIDKALVLGLEGDPVRAQMVTSAVNLGATMGLDVVAEGVETEGVRRRLLELGCTRGQGWLFSAAVPAGAVRALLAPGALTPADGASVELPEQRPAVQGVEIS